MPTTDEMNVDERRKYLKRMWPRYQKADRAERTRLLTEMEQVTGMACRCFSDEKIRRTI